MLKFIYLVVFFFVATACRAQKVETVYMNPADSTRDLYVVIHPTTFPVKGFLVLIPGMFQKAADVLVQTNLASHAATRGILTVVPTFTMGISSFGIDTATQRDLVRLLEKVNVKYTLGAVPFYLGGFSIGGSCAVKYAELALRNNLKFKPTAIFAIDAPLDFERMYNSMLRDTRFPGTSAEILAETNYMLKYVERFFGGAPANVVEKYRKESPYSYTDTLQFAIRPLINLPIRFYSEPDIHWWLREGVDYSGMNAFDLAAMTNELRRMGNQKIMLITTENKGFRNGKERNPHAWSIAEPVSLVSWLQEQK